MRWRGTTKTKFGLMALLLGGTAVTGATLADRVAETGDTTIAASPPAVFHDSLGKPASLADMVEAVGPSVVQIQVRPEAQLRQMGYGMPNGNSDPLEQRLRDLFGLEEAPESPGPEQRGSSRGREGGALGSGFIVDASGIVVTNNHVVGDATNVSVQTSDGREYKARVLGRDPQTDLAVIQIEGGGKFRAITWGDSDRTRVGDSVFAVGSPFGLGNTVTSGIVSARGREIGAGPYDDFLQVDAAINSGNSGGPLFDAKGRVVGVNTAIFSPSGGNVGIGFAIPAHMAKRVAQQIASNGHVARGRIGVALQPLTADVAERLGVTGTKGAVIAQIDGSGTAARSGLREGDVVRRFADQPVDDTSDLARMVAETRAGTKVPLSVIRDGRQMEVTLAIGREQRG